jgi:hypothetical protein
MRGRVKYIYLTLVGFMAAVWFLTPLPSWIAGFMVNQIPISDDIAIGYSATLHHPYRVINDNGKLNSMGMQIVSSIAAQVRDLLFHFPLCLSFFLFLSVS